MKKFKLKCFVHIKSGHEGQPLTLFFDELPPDTYFMSDCQHEKDLGKAMLQVWDNGTCLSPFVDETGKNIYFPEYAGKELKDI